MIKLEPYANMSSRFQRYNDEAAKGDESRDFIAIKNRKKHRSH